MFPWAGNSHLTPEATRSLSSTALAMPMTNKMTIHFILICVLVRSVFCRKLVVPHVSCGEYLLSVTPAPTHLMFAGCTYAIYGELGSIGQCLQASKRISP